MHAVHALIFYSNPYSNHSDSDNWLQLKAITVFAYGHNTTHSPVCRRLHLTEIKIRYDGVYSRAPKSWRVASLICRMEPNKKELEMWANAQRDGRHAEQVAPSVHRRKVLLALTTYCRAVTLPRRGSRWKLLRCPKLPKRSQPLRGPSLPYYGDMWRRYCCLTSFFSNCRYMP